MPTKAYPATNSSRVLVRGGGDVGSAVAYYLFQAGYPVAIHEIPLPTTTRRKMAFVDAVFKGSALLEEVEARRVDDLALLTELLRTPQLIPVVVAELARLLEVMQPEVLIDARMRKHHQPEVQRGLAWLTIGLVHNRI